MPSFDRFDIVTAWYAWLSDNHAGQWSPEYARLSRMLGYFRPGYRDGTRESLSENARAIYDNIARVSAVARARA